MIYWDASALVPLFVQEARSAALRKLFASDSEVATWWGTSIECAAAFARLSRERRIKELERDALERELDRWASGWILVTDLGRVGAHTRRLLRVHSLRGADALQLASAMVAAEGGASPPGFACLDARLSDAARREGFSVLP